MTLFVGAAIPMIVLGRGAVGVMLICGLLLAFLDYSKALKTSLRELPSHPLARLIALTTICWLPSLFFSPEPAVSGEVLFRSLFFLAGAFVFYGAFRHDDLRYTALLKTIVVSSLFFYLIASVLLTTRKLYDLDLMESIDWANSFLSLIRGNGWDHADYDIKLHLKESTSSGLLLFPLIALCAIRLRGWWACICALVLFELVFTIWLAENRSSIAGLGAICLTAAGLLAHERRTSHATLLAALALITIIGIIAGWLLFAAPSYTYISNNAQFSIPFWLIDPPRQEIWAFAWKAGHIPQWFGVGINTIDKLPNASDWNTIVGTRNIPLHPHNWVIEVLVETGVVGFAALMGAIVYSIYSLARRFMVSGHSGALAALCVMVSYWTNGLFSVSYWSSWWQVSFYVATAICLAGVPKNKYVSKSAQ